MRFFSTCLVVLLSFAVIAITLRRADSDARRAEQQEVNDSETDEPSKMPGPVSEWGVSVAGNRIRVSAPQFIRQMKDGPHLKIDYHQRPFRNPEPRGTEKPPEELVVATHRGMGCRLSVDGHWYRWRGPFAMVGMAYHRMSTLASHGYWGRLPLNDKWRRIADDEPLRLKKGTHAIMVAWPAFYPDPTDERKPNLHRPVMLVSGQLNVDLHRQ